MFGSIFVGLTEIICGAELDFDDGAFYLEEKVIAY